MSLTYPVLAQSGAQESQSVTSFQAQTSFDESQATQVTLAAQTATVTGQGASFSDQTLTITQAGTYVLTGSGKNIKLVVEAADPERDRQLDPHGPYQECARGGRRPQGVRRDLYRQGRQPWLQDRGRP